jgi:hypothetical protein
MEWKSGIILAPFMRISHIVFWGKISVPSELLRALRMSGNGNVQLCRPENDEDQECVKLAASVRTLNSQV